MSRAHIASLAAFLAFAMAGIAGFFASAGVFTGFALFFGAGVIGSIVASLVFKRLATPEQRRQDLEERVRSEE